jgi:DNA-binding LacI/PurR family transcriptional regulator
MKIVLTILNSCAKFINNKTLTRNNMQNINTDQSSNETISTATTIDIARLAKVSVGTVSRVVNNEPRVDETLRIRVLKAIEELGYIHTPKKRRNISTKSEILVNTITFYTPANRSNVPGNAYFYQILNGVKQECLENDLKLLFESVEDNPGSISRLKSAIETGYADALILTNFGDKKLLTEVITLGKPLTLIDPFAPVGLAADVAMADSFGGGMLATEHLISLGHRQIAMIKGIGRYSMERRLDGYRAALAQNDITYRPELVIPTQVTREHGEIAVEQLLNQNIKFTAIFCANDPVAFGAIRALNRAGLRVPQDVSVLGFDDTEPAANFLPTLTSVNSNLEGKGSLAVRLLIERAKRPDLPFVSAFPQVRLVRRESTARCPD